MHVLFLPSWYPANPDDLVGSFFREQALALRRAGCQVGVIAPALRSLRKPAAALLGSGVVRSEDDEGIQTFRASAAHWTPGLWGPTLSRVQRLVLRLFADYVSTAGRPDLIHVQGALPAGAGAIALSARFNLPFLLSEHSSAFTRNRVSAAGLAAARTMAVAARSRFAVSSTFANQLANRLNMQPEDWFVMPNPVSAQFLEPEFKSRPKNGFRFLHISLLDANKNVQMLLAAFAAQFRGRVNVELVIGGDGPERTALISKAETLGISTQVRFIGKLSRQDVRNELAACDVFVLPSKVETFGVVLVEALAMGRPVIATRCGGPEDIVTPATGLLVPVDDVAALGGAMVAVHRHPEHWDPVTLREDCRRRFGPDAITRRWIEHYEAILAGRKAGA